MADPILLRFRAQQGGNVDVPVVLAAVGKAARERFAATSRTPGVHVLLGGDRDYLVSLTPPVGEETIRLLQASRKKTARVVFPGRTPVRRRIDDVAIVPAREAAA